MQAAPDTLATLNYVSRLRSTGKGAGGGTVVTATWEEATGVILQKERR